MVICHAISGVMSSFLAKDKKSTWSAWTTCHTVTVAFTTLSSQPEEIDPKRMIKLERFIIIMCSISCALIKLYEPRKQLFSQGSATIK